MIVTGTEGVLTLPPSRQYSTDAVIFSFLLHVVQEERGRPDALT